MTTFTYDQVLAACPTGPAKGSRAAALMHVIDAQDYPDGLSVARATGIWIIDFLYGQVPAEDAACFVFAVPAATVHAISYDPEAYGYGPPPTVTVTAGRYVGFSGVRRVYDKDAPGWVDVIPPDWFETRVFNVAQLVKLCLSRIPKGDKAGT